MTDLRALKEKIDAATGPSSDLNYRICDALGYTSPPVDYRAYNGNVSDSIDAVLALVERVLPGWCLNINTHRNSCMLAPDGVWHMATLGKAATPPLAILSALLAALIAQEDG